MANYAPSAPTGNRSRTGLWITIVAVFALIVGLAVGRWVVPSTPTGTGSGSTAPSGTQTAGGLGGPHGPARIVNGVPSGYTRDKTGAATAAANAVQVQVAAAHGQADPETVKSTWIAGNADEKTRQALSQGRNTDGQNRTNRLPTDPRVTAYSDDAATVEIWVASVGFNPAIGGGTTSTVAWSTSIYQLVWEDGDWKVRTFTSVDGPQPGKSDKALPSASTGQYTFYID